jgi:hypothetical protein
MCQTPELASTLGTFKRAVLKPWPRLPSAWPRLHALGALGFLTGSVLFVLSSRSGSLPIYQLGCAIWIAGCFVFLVPVGAQLLRAPWQLSAILQGACMLLFVAGCALPCISSEEAVVLPLFPAANSLFLVGSACVLADAVVTWLLRAHAGLCGWPRWLEALDLSIAFCFTFAAVFGGFGPNPELVMVGVWSWGVASVLLFPEPLCALLAQRRSSRSQKRAPSRCQVPVTPGGASSSAEKVADIV